MFGQMKAARDREWQEGFARERLRREGLAEKYNLPDDLGGMLADFERKMLRHVPPERMADALVDLYHYPLVGGPLTLRCRWFGCKPRGPCYLAPYCTGCEGRCTRCANYVLATATSLTR